MYTPTQPVLDQLARNFRYHPPAGNQVTRYGVLRELAGQFAHHVATNTPASREQSLALTKLEEAVMWANAAIARHEVWDGQKLLAPLKLDFGGPAS